MVAQIAFSSDDHGMDFPELSARAGSDPAGAPRAITVCADGARVVFLRSTGPDDPVDRLWIFDVERGEERLIYDPRCAASEAAPAPAGIDAYALDATGRIAVFALGAQLIVADLISGEVRAYPTVAPATDPRPDPTGHRIAYLTGGTLRILDLATGADTLLAGEAENPQVTWGYPDFIGAHEFHQRRGHWWAPDSNCVLALRVDNARVRRWYQHDPATPEAMPVARAYPSAGTTNAELTLHLLDLDDGWVDVHWDRETYPYLVAVSWSEAGGPLVTVLRRLQQHGLVLAVDPRTGETQVHAELADPRWVEPVAGTPCHLPDGRVLIGGELAHDGYDARCLFADGGLLTPPSLYVRRVCGRAAGNTLLVEASEGEPSEQHLYQVGTHPSLSTVDVQRLTSAPGWHIGHAGGDTLVIGAASLDHAGTVWTVYSAEVEVGRLTSPAATESAATESAAPRPALERVTDRRLPTGVLYPRTHVAGRRLPVLVEGCGGPGQQGVIATRAAWLARQRWADAGFAVVVVDNRGTPGVAPSFEKMIHRRIADVVLTDQVEALEALADKHPDLDLTRVGIRGRAFGGWLAALAVLRRPDIYRWGIAESPIVDWELHTTAYAERYLGLPADAGDVYTHASLVESAAEPVVTADDARPLLIVHRTDELASVHPLRLSAALLAGERPHAVIPLNGPVDPAARMRLELDFIRRSLAA